MLAGHRLQLFAEVELLIGEGSNLRVHTSLTTEDTHAVTAVMVLFPADETLKQRHPTVADSDGQQQRVVNTSIRLILLDNGRQLFIVAYQHKTVDAACALTVGGKDAHQTGFKNLRGLIDDGHRKVLQVEEERLRLDHRCRTHDDRRLEDALTDERQLGL